MRSINECRARQVSTCPNCGAEYFPSMRPNLDGRPICTGVCPTCGKTVRCCNDGLQESDWFGGNERGELDIDANSKLEKV